MEKKRGIDHDPTFDCTFSVEVQNLNQTGGDDHEEKWQKNKNEDSQDHNPCYV
ncbi:MAG: hypothetical protein ABSB22_19975 [Thermodesulfobacteriota bacterium]